MFKDPLRRKCTKSRFRYYPNDDASFNVELNPGPPAERQDSVQSKTISFLFLFFLSLEIAPKYKAKQSKNGKFPSNYMASPIDFET